MFGSARGEHQKVFDDARKGGFVRVRVDGEMHDLSEDFNLKKTFKHNIEIVVDRLVVTPDIRSRLAESVEAASALAGGLTLIDAEGGGAPLLPELCLPRPRSQR